MHNGSRTALAYKARMILEGDHARGVISRFEYGGWNQPIMVKLRREFDKIIKLGEIYTSPGFCDEILYLYLATDLTAGKHNREEGEYGMEIFEYSLAKVDEMIKNGEIVDAKTIAIISHYKNLLTNA